MLSVHESYNSRAVATSSSAITQICTDYIFDCEIGRSCLGIRSDPEIRGGIMQQHFQRFTQGLWILGRNGQPCFAVLDVVASGLAAMEAPMLDSVVFRNAGLRRRVCDGRPQVFGIGFERNSISIGTMHGLLTRGCETKPGCVADNGTSAPGEGVVPAPGLLDPRRVPARASFSSVEAVGGLA